MVAKGEGVGGGMEWEVGVSRYKLLYIEWITTRSYCIQYPVIIHMEKNIFRKECVYIYIHTHTHTEI